VVFYLEGDIKEDKAAKAAQLSFKILFGFQNIRTNGNHTLQSSFERKPLTPKGTSNS
jgi:hypothetical protein